jgi:hypothetical protein
MQVIAPEKSTCSPRNLKKKTALDIQFSTPTSPLELPFLWFRDKVGNVECNSSSNFSVCVLLARGDISNY